MSEKEQHGSVIAYLAYATKKNAADADEVYHRIGCLIYYRSHKDDAPPSAQIRLDLIPASAWAEGNFKLIGRFMPTEKVPEPPYIDGDLFAATEQRGLPVICGHIHTDQNENSKKAGEYESDATIYFGTLSGLPVYQWLRIHDSQKELKSIYLNVRMD